MEVSYEKSKILVNEFDNNETAYVLNLTMNDEPLQVLDTLKYLSATLTKD